MIRKFLCIKIEIKNNKCLIIVNIKTYKIKKKLKREHHKNND